MEHYGWIVNYMSRGHIVIGTIAMIIPMGPISACGPSVDGSPLFIAATGRGFPVLRPIEAFTCPPEYRDTAAALTSQW